MDRKARCEFRKNRRTAKINAVKAASKLRKALKDGNQDQADLELVAFKKSYLKYGWSARISKSRRYVRKVGF